MSDKKLATAVHNLLRENNIEGELRDMGGGSYSIRVDKEHLEAVKEILLRAKAGKKQ